MNKWHLFFSGILHLLLHSQVFGNESRGEIHTQGLGNESCGKFLARHMIENYANSSIFEGFISQMEIEYYHRQYAGKACDNFARWLHYFMHQKNIGEVKNMSQLREDIKKFPKYSNTPNYQTRDELNRTLNVNFLQEEQDNAPRTALCQIQPSFTVNEALYFPLGQEHIFVLEKGGKNEFRLWQAWILHFSALEWLKEKITNEAESRNTNYTRGTQSLNRQEAEQMVNDLITYSDSNLDWNKREQLGAKLFWTNQNIFTTRSGKIYYFDSNGKVSRNTFCEKEFEDASKSLKERVKEYLSDPEVLKAEEKRRRLNMGCEDNKTLVEWLLLCDTNEFSMIHDDNGGKWKKCYMDFSKTIDLSKIPNLPKVQIATKCEVTSNPNNGEQCAQNMRDIHRIMKENP